MATIWPSYIGLKVNAANVQNG